MPLPRDDLDVDGRGVDQIERVQPAGDDNDIGSDLLTSCEQDPIAEDLLDWASQTDAGAVTHRIGNQCHRRRRGIEDAVLFEEQTSVKARSEGRLEIRKAFPIDDLDLNTGGREPLRLRGCAREGGVIVGDPEGSHQIQSVVGGEQIGGLSPQSDRQATEFELDCVSIEVTDVPHSRGGCPVGPRRLPALDQDYRSTTSRQFPSSGGAGDSGSDDDDPRCSHRLASVAVRASPTAFW